MRESPPVGDVIDIAFGIDGNYVPHLAAVIQSIMRHAPAARFRFIVLHPDVPQERQKLLESSAPGASFVWTKVRDEDLPAFTQRGHFNRAIMLRLSLETVAPADCMRVIYLDTDVIVAGDIREVWETDLEGAPVAAVADAYQDMAEFAGRWTLPENDLGYFNSGLLLIDLNQVRQGELFSETMRIIVEHDKALRFPDQCALNIVFWGHWKPLPLKWNVQRNNAIPAMSAELPLERRLENAWPSMIHYTGPQKPWVHDGYHPWSWLYWENLRKTPFFDEVARASGIDAKARFLLWVRWLRRRPHKMAA
jgi:lipopolysaccharide biosynthesis glycosyltransferase